MTFERQDILEDFYAGNSRDLNVTVYIDEAKTTVKDLTGAELTYTLFTDENVVLITKSSTDGGISVPTPGNGQCIIHLLPPDTAHINGEYRHMLNVVDGSGYEDTVLTGKVRIFKSHSKRPRKDSVSAYLEGG